MSASSFTPIPPAFQAKGRPMILALRPPIRAIPVRARERYHNVLVPVPRGIDQSNVSGPRLYCRQRCDGRPMAPLVRRRANKRRDCQYTDSPPHDVSLLLLLLFRRPAHFHTEARLDARDWVSPIIKAISGLGHAVIKYLPSGAEQRSRCPALITKLAFSDG